MKTNEKKPSLLKSFALFLALILMITLIPAESICAKSNVKLNKTKLTLTVGESKTLKLKNNKKKVKWTSTKKAVATVSKKGKVTAKKKGTATIKAKVGKKTYTCKVTVKAKSKNVWDKVKVVIPETIGEQDTPENRMKIENYSFYGATSSYYHMDISFKLVEYGRTGRSNWGEYFYCYDSNGNILKKCFLYAGSLALNRSYTEDALIPIKTKKIVFMEYPNTSTPENTTPDASTEDTTTDTPKWRYSDAKSLNDSASKATKAANSAADYYNSAVKYSQTAYKVLYAQQAINQIDSAKSYLNKALTLANSKLSVSTTSGYTLAELIQQALDTYNVLTITTVDQSNIDTALSQLKECAINGNIRCLGVESVSADMLKAFGS